MGFHLFRFKTQGVVWLGFVNPFAQCSRWATDSSNPQAQWSLSTLCKVQASLASATASGQEVPKTASTGPTGVDSDARE